MTTCPQCGAKAAADAKFCSACGTALGGGAPRRGHPDGLFEYVPHPRMETRRHRAPKGLQQPAEAPGLLERFNDRLGVAITHGVGTMWCAYVFAIIALISLPEAVKGGVGPLIAWIAQTFLQLVLLSIIMVGQRVEGAAAENRAIDTYKDAEALLAEAVAIQKHLLAQDAALQRLLQAGAGGNAQAPGGIPAKEA